MKIAKNNVTDGWFRQHAAPPPRRKRLRSSHEVNAHSEIALLVSRKETPSNVFVDISLTMVARPMRWVRWKSRFRNIRY